MNTYKPKKHDVSATGSGCNIFEISTKKKLYSFSGSPQSRILALEKHFEVQNWKHPKGGFR